MSSEVLQLFQNFETQRSTKSAQDNIRSFMDSTWSAIEANAKQLADDDSYQLGDQTFTHLRAYYGRKAADFAVMQEKYGTVGNYWKKTLGSDTAVSAAELRHGLQTFAALVKAGSADTEPALSEIDVAALNKASLVEKVTGDRHNAGSKGLNFNLAGVGGGALGAIYSLVTAIQDSSFQPSTVQHTCTQNPWIYFKKIDDVANATAAFDQCSNACSTVKNIYGQTGTFNISGQPAAPTTDGERTMCTCTVTSTVPCTKPPVGQH